VLNESDKTKRIQFVIGPSLVTGHRHGVPSSRFNRCTLMIVSFARIGCNVPLA